MSFDRIQCTYVGTYLNEILIEIFVVQPKFCVNEMSLGDTYNNVLLIKTNILIEIFFN